jgi:hypothetical protein
MVPWNEEYGDVTRTTSSASRRLGKAAAAAASETSYRSDGPTTRMMNGKVADKKKEAAVGLPPRRSNDHGLAQEDRDLPPLYHVTTVLRLHGFLDPYLSGHGLS